MNRLYVIKPQSVSDQLNSMITAFIENCDCVFIDDIHDIPELSGKHILFALELNEAGFCSDVLLILNELCKRGSSALLNARGAVLAHSATDLYTKSSSNHLIFIANNLGCSFIGHPLVEATGSLGNFTTWQKTMSMSLEEICLDQCRRLSQRLVEENKTKYTRPKIVALHASSRKTSNTLMLWNMIKNEMNGCEIKELNVENGTVHDCIGCAFTTCIHYSKQNSCFYGGIMVQEIIPAIEEADVLFMICPNYNDAVSANLTAVINRTTALYRKMSFHEKHIFSIVVSGNSGGDSVARQLIDALCINKGFQLAPYSCILATANDVGSLKLIPDIEQKAYEYAQHILNCIMDLG